MTWIGKIEDYLLKKVVHFLGGQKELSIQLDLTNSCNLKCSHCYHPHHSNKGAIGLQGWFNILDQYHGLLAKLKLNPNIILCGGEPLASPYLFPILDRIYQKWGEVPIVILTNGTLLTEAKLKALSKYKVRFQVSVDGPDARRHDQFRGSGNFDKAIAGAKLACKHGYQVSFLSVLSKKTSDWIEDFFNMANSNGFESMNFTRLIPQGQGQLLVNSGEDETLTGFDLKNAMRRIVDCSESSGVKTATSQPLYHLIDPRLGMNGRFGFQGLVVDYKGNLKVSSRADFVIGNIISDGLEPLFLNHPVMKSLRSKRIEGCGGCQYFARCGGDRNISYATTGSFLNKDTGCWINLENNEQRSMA